MKKFGKILSIVLVLTMVLTVCVMPASALDCSIDVEVKATVENTDSNGLNTYKIDCYVDSTHSLVNITLNLSWNDSAFQLLKSDGKSNATAVSYKNVAVEDPDNVLTEDFAYENYDGEFLGDGEDDYASFPCDGSTIKLLKISGTNLGTTLTGYTGLTFSYQSDVTGNVLLVSGGKIRGTESAIGGKVKIFSFYLKDKAGVEPGIYEVGVNAQQKALLTGTFTNYDVMVNSKMNQDMTSIVLGADVNYTNAMIPVGMQESSIINHSKDQIRFHGQGKGAYDNAFDVRTLAVIKEADFVKTFGEDATQEGPCAAIKKAGFVFERVSQGHGNLTPEVVEAYVKSGAALPSTCKDAPVDYISTAMGDYVISCMVKDIDDSEKTDGLKSVAYIMDADGNVYCYDTVIETSFQNLYDTWFSQAFPG